MPLKKNSRRHKELVARIMRKQAKKECKFKVACKRCGYRWKAKVRKPKSCARCKAQSWNKSVKEAPKRANRRKRFWQQAKDQRFKDSLRNPAKRMKQGRLMIREGSRYVSREKLARRKRDRARREQKRQAKQARSRSRKAARKTLVRKIATVTKAIVARKAPARKAPARKIRAKKADRDRAYRVKAITKKSIILEADKTDMPAGNVA